MDAKQFAWVYLITHGNAGVHRSYYGGYDLVDPQAKAIKLKRSWDQSPITEAYLKAIKQVGVNWAKTAAPDSESMSLFNGTFAEEQCLAEVLNGTLVLRDGTKQTWTADALEVTNVFEMMANVQKSVDDFAKIFGEAA